MNTCSPHVFDKLSNVKNQLLKNKHNRIKTNIAGGKGGDDFNPL